jgi:NAD(P)H-dependent flavin oxidoreductase YrpB (nitropropane dioxygenase family)
MFGAEFPVFAFSHCKDVAAAVTNAGGVGVLGELGRSPDQIVQDIRWMRQQVGDKPFGIDLVFPASVPTGVPSLEELQLQIPEAQWKFMDRVFEENNIPRPKGPVNRQGVSMGGLFSQEVARRQLDAVLEETVPFIASGLGNPAFVVEAAHAKGILIGGLVGKVRQARRELEGGVDVIIAQGYDAGGHTGEIGTFTLVPRVVQIAGDTPVLLAGGVGTGAHLAAALCLGAQGVWGGSIWLASRESDMSMGLKQRLIEATEEDTIRSRALTGKPARQLRNRYNMLWEDPKNPPALPMPLQGILTAELQAAIRENEMSDWMGTPLGQMVGNITSLKSCSEIVLDMVNEALDVLESVSVERVGAPA